MVEFYKRFIHPSLPARSKLAIHLKTQSPSSVSAAEEDGDVDVQGNCITPYVIDNVREFKSMLQISAGPQLVKNIREFETWT
jgi:insulysin